MFLDISSLRFVKVVKFAADSITEYGIPREKIKMI